MEVASWALVWEIIFLIWGGVRRSDLVIINNSGLLVRAEL